MDYEQHYTDHLIHLTLEETDRFFAPFDPHDPGLPSYLLNSRHRFIKDELYEWLMLHVGAVGLDWNHERLGRDCRTIRFKSKDKAALFKLTFGGQT
jgi:hypothetical protein